MRIDANIFSGHVAGSKGMTIEMCAEPKMRKTNNPFIGRVIKHTTFIHPYLGCKYESMVNRQGARQGIDDTFKADSIKWATNLNAYFIEHNGTKDMYLKVGVCSDTIVKSSYTIDGREATAEEVEQIQSFMQSSGDSQKQLAYGIEADKQVKWRTINMENIISIRQGSRTYYEK